MLPSFVSVDGVSLSHYHVTLGGFCGTPATPSLHCSGYHRDITCASRYMCRVFPLHQFGEPKQYDDSTVQVPPGLQMHVHFEGLRHPGEAKARQVQYP